MPNKTIFSRSDLLTAVQLAKYNKGVQVTLEELHSNIVDARVLQ